MKAMRLFTFTATATGKRLEIKIAGHLDEESEMKIVQPTGFDEIEINLSGVRIINSCGVRQWIRWVGDMPKNVRYQLVGCPKIFVDSANMISGFIPKGWIVQSVEVPYFCESCENVTLSRANTASGVLETPPKMPCSKCDSHAELDVEPGHYLSAIKAAHGSGGES